MVYPHPAHIVLFGLDRIVKYKKGAVEAKREGQRLFTRYLSELLPKAEPSLNVPCFTDPSELRGQALKDNEPDKKAMELYAKHSTGSAKGNKVYTTEQKGTMKLLLKDRGSWTLKTDQ